MDNESWIEEVISLYFRDGNVNEIEDITRKEHKEDVLKDICQVWEEKAKKAPVLESRGWRYQQATLI